VNQCPLVSSIELVPPAELLPDSRAISPSALHEAIVLPVTYEGQNDNIPVSDGIEQPVERRKIHAIKVRHSESDCVLSWDRPGWDHLTPLTVSLDVGDDRLERLPYRLGWLPAPRGILVKDIERLLSCGVHHNRGRSKGQGPASQPLTHRHRVEKLRAHVVGPLDSLRPFDGETETEVVV
jgi:hypothetical protein